MISYIAAAALIVFALLGVIVRKTIFSIPLAEQKRRAIHGSARTKALYRVAAYDGSTRVLLWTWISVAAAAGFVVLSGVAPAWLSFIVVVLVLWFGFSWLPANQDSSMSLQITLWVVPTLSWLLNTLYRPLSASAKVVAKRYTKQPHTGVYEREDIIELIDRQQTQADSRLSDEELEIIKRAFTFSERTVGEALTPIEKIATIKPNDTVGPVLINEVHASGQPFVIVREKAKEPILGVLAFDALDLHSSGQVSDHMDTHVYYLHEKDSLTEALHAFYATNRPVFLVLNTFEEVVGGLTINNILEQLLGHIPGDDFDEYTDASAVARRHTPQEPTKKPDIDYEEVLE